MNKFSEDVYGASFGNLLPKDPVAELGVEPHAAAAVIGDCVCSFSVETITDTTHLVEANGRQPLPVLAQGQKIVVKPLVTNTRTDNGRPVTITGKKTAQTEEVPNTVSDEANRLMRWSERVMNCTGCVNGECPARVETMRELGEQALADAERIAELERRPQVVVHRSGSRSRQPQLSAAARAWNWGIDQILERRW